MQEKEVPYNIQLAAAKDILDRAGIGTTRELEIAVKPWERDLEGLVFDQDDVVDAEVLDDELDHIALPPHDREEPSAVEDVADHPPQYGVGHFA